MRKVMGFSVIIGICNSLTSLYAGMTVFGVIGYIATQKDADIEDVVTEGPGLAFIVYPEAVSLMDVAPLFSFLFFFMLTLLSISSVCASWEALISAWMDEFPVLRKKRSLVMLVSAVYGFLCGISMCFESGFLMFTILNNRTASAILLMAFVELIATSWFYGIDNVMRHIKEMGMDLPRPVALYWRTCWMYVTPAIVGSITILAWVYFEPDSVEDYEFPIGAQILGWLIELFPFAVTILGGVIAIWQRKESGESFAFLKTGPMMRPNEQWGPRADSGLPLHSWKGASVDDDVTRF